MENLHSFFVTLKRRKRVVVVAGAGVVIALTVWLTRAREPSYEGRTLSYWTAELWRQIPTPSNKTRPDAEAAVRHIGTNSIPYLMRWISYEPHPRPVATAIGGLVSRLPGSLRNETTQEIEDWARWDKALWRADGVPHVFAELGATARSSIPDLEKLSQDTAHPAVCRRAMYALTAINTNVQPTVLAQLTNSNPEKRIDAMIALIHFAHRVKDLDRAVPALRDCLQHTNEAVRSGAACALGSISVPSSFVVPELTGALKDQSLSVRIQATNALVDIAPELVLDPPPRPRR